MNYGEYGVYIGEIQIDEFVLNMLWWELDMDVGSRVALDSEFGRRPNSCHW